MKKKAGFLLLTCEVASALVCAQEISVKQEPPISAVDGKDLYIARYVLRDFFRFEKHPECYEVLFSEFEGNLRVDFVPKNQTVVLQEGEVDAGPAPCGRNVGYVIDKSGKILRRIYSR